MKFWSVFQNPGINILPQAIFTQNYLKVSCLKILYTYNINVTAQWINIVNVIKH